MQMTHWTDKLNHKLISVSYSLNIFQFTLIFSCNRPVSTL